MNPLKPSRRPKRINSQGLNWVLQATDKYKYCQERLKFAVRVDGVGTGATNGKIAFIIKADLLGDCYATDGKVRLSEAEYRAKDWIAPNLNQILGLRDNPVKLTELPEKGNAETIWYFAEGKDGGKRDVAFVREHIALALNGFESPKFYLERGFAEGRWVPPLFIENDERLAAIMPRFP